VFCRPEAAHNKGGQATKQKWVDALQLAKRGKFDDIDPHIQIQYFTSLRKIYNETLLQQACLDGELENLWYFGPPGTGKSRFARDKHPDAFCKALNHWWDGYAGEDTVIIDEWEIGSGKFLGHHLKIWADRYAFKMEIKGSVLPMQRPKKIIITSNYSIDECFGSDRMLCAAIHRRFRSVDFGLVPYTRPDGSVIEAVD
jgi:hypothetical protein